MYVPFIYLLMVYRGYLGLNTLVGFDLQVKNPVLCPNQHVFCGPCMDVWLQKNKQCPACRTSMTAGKKIIGENIELLLNFPIEENNGFPISCVCVHKPGIVCIYM